MTTESFTVEEFAKVLEDAGYRYDKLGWMNGEMVFAVDLGKQVSIRIRSSIRNNGYAANSGEDSIRLWLAYQGQSLSAKGVPTGINERYIQCVAGWQKRLITQIEKLKFFRQVLGDCRDCGKPNMALVSRTAKNPGRIFTKCTECGKWGIWLDTDAILKQAVLPMLGANMTSPINSNGKTEEKGVFVPSIGKGTDTVMVAESDDNLTAGLSFLSDASALTVSEEDKPQEPKTFTPSKYQENIRDFVLNSDKPLQIKAYAGSGKTSTNAWVCGFIPERSTDVAMMVFSKANQLDMEKKIPSWIPATTTHSAGYADIRRAWGNSVKVDDRKVWSLLRETYANNWDIRDNGPQIVKLISLCKNTLREPNEDNLNYLCQRFSINLNGDSDEVYEAVDTLYRKSIERRDTIDFDDMLFLPASKCVPVAKHDLLFVDEYQDNNEAQKQYYLQTGARIVFVGDDHQAVYGFRGAMIGAMAEMQERLGAESLSLPISYRCAKSIIALAQTLVPEIQARENAPDGIIQDVNSLSTIKPGDMVLCRNNAPLVRPCFKLIASGIKANIKGRDLGTGLVSFVKKIEKKFRPSTFRELLITMQDYVMSERRKLIDLGKDSQAAKLEDDSETVIALSDGVYSVSELEARISKIFSDDTPGITFSTIHKAKGLEADRVFVLNRELLSPQKYDKQAWQLEQLFNLTYVCYTRARHELYFVH